MANRDWKPIALWVLTGLLALLLAFAGAQKFIDAETWKANFEGWGYPAWFSYVIGAVEIGGAIAMVIPRTSSYGAAVLTGNMAGAAVTRMLEGAWANVPVDVVLMLLLAFIAYVRRPAWAETWFPR